MGEYTSPSITQVHEPGALKSVSVRHKKVAKEAVNYRQADDEQKCAACRFYADDSCQIVAGEIEPSATCDRWQAIAKFYVPIEKGLDSVLIFPISSYYRDGKQRRFTRADAEEMVRNFEADVIERQPPVNLEHDKPRGRVGWIRQLWVADDGVRGKVKPADGEDLSRFDYVSPEVRWRWTHPYTGKEHRNVLFGLALTNYPFFLGKTALWTQKGWSLVEKMALVEITPASLRKAQEQEIVSLHRRLHQLHGRHFAGNRKETTDGLTREDLTNWHVIVVEEMKRRGIQHDSPIEKARYRRDLCMKCKEKPPSVDVLWAEGMAHAWFCSACFGKWKAESEWHEVVATKPIEHGIARKSFKDRGSPKAIDKAQINLVTLPDEILVTPDVVCIVGSQATGGANSKADTDVLFRFELDKDDDRYFRLRRENIDLPVRKALGVSKEDFHPLDNPQGPHADHIPLYDLVLKRKGDHKLAGPGPDTGPVKVDLGSGPNPPDGYLAIDKQPYEAVDIVHDLEQGIPLSDDCADEVRAWHFLEHMPNPKFILGECWRVLKPSGVLVFEVPSTKGQGAFAHPDHKSYWNRLSFLFYSDDRLRAAAGVSFKFEVLELEEWEDAEHEAAYVRGRLRAVKPVPALVEKALRPFGKFTPPKPKMAAYTEVFSPAELWDKWAAKRIAQGIAVEPKLNGFRAYAMKLGNRVDIRFEDADKSRAKQLPQLIEVLKRIPGDFILDCDVGIERDGKRLPRIALMMLTADRPELQENDRVVCTVFDLPYWEEDLHERPFHERRSKLEQFYRQYLKASRNFSITSVRVAKTKQKFLIAAKWAGGVAASEGAVAKTLDGSYSLSGATDEWAKYKHIVELKVIVFESIRNRAGGWNYRCGVFKGESPYTNTRELGGKTYIDLGKTFSTKLKAGAGSVLTVHVHEIIPQRKGEEETLVWLGPHVVDIDRTRKQPYFANQVVDIARRGRVLQEVRKAVDEEGEEKGPRVKAATQFWEEHWHELLPKSGRGRFVYQHHYRGLDEEEAKLGETELLALPRGVSVHGDLRFEGEGALWGWSLLIGTAEANRKAGGDRLLVLPPDDAIQAQPKLAQPRRWLRIGVRKPRVFGPGEPGATADKSAKFFVVDHGTYKLGVCREHYFEVFLKGKKLKGRYNIQYARFGDRRSWVIGKPADQRPYAETHDKDRVIAELKRKGQKWLAWSDGTGRPEFVDVAKAKVEKSAFVHEVPFALADATKRIAYGIVLQPDEPDSQDHASSAEEIEAACHRFMERLQLDESVHLDEHHLRLVQSDEARVVECWIQREPVIWVFSADGKERTTKVLPGSWCLGVKFYSDDLWQQVLDEEITGFSPKGWGILRLLTKPI